MKLLIFCSFEVGGFPYQMASALNHSGIQVFYISIAHSTNDHDSTNFHFKDTNKPWNISSKVNQHSSKKELVSNIQDTIKSLGIDGCFATGKSCYLLEKAGIPYKYWCYGGDLDQFWFYKKNPQNTSKFLFWIKDRLHYMKSYLYMRMLRVKKANAFKSIFKADAIMIAPYQYAAASHFGMCNNLFFLPHLLLLKGFREILTLKKIAKEELCQIFGSDHLFFSSSRHEWGVCASKISDNKGNDIMIRAFAQYCETNHLINSKFILVNKGRSISDSVKLINELGIKDNVVWIDEVSRPELEKYYLGASICFGQFGTPVLTYSTVEPLACATPVVSYFETNDNVPFYDSLPPICNSRDINDIVSFMSFVTNNTSEEEIISKNSWEWANSNCSESAFTKEFVKIL